MHQDINVASISVKPQFSLIVFCLSAPSETGEGELQGVLEEGESSAPVPRQHEALGFSEVRCD